jgi:hypothetical protein
LLTGNKNWAVVLYAIVLFPGVLLHEISHWITATLLGVRTGSFSVLPRTKSDGSIQLGYVEYYKTSSVGPIRESLIGSAPLVAGTAVIILIGFYVFDVTTLAAAVEAGDIDLLTQAIGALFATGDFLLWLYLIFAISNAMMPSASDRRAWPAFALILFVFAVLLYLLWLSRSCFLSNHRRRSLLHAIHSFIGVACQSDQRGRPCLRQQGHANKVMRQTGGPVWQRRFMIS